MLRHLIGSRPRRIVDLALWVITIGTLVVIVGAWLFPYDLDRYGTWYDRGAWLAVMVRSLGTHIGIALTAMLLAALVRRRWMLSVLLAALVVFLVLPLAHRPEREQRPRTDRSIRVMSTNVLYSNTDYDGALASIDRAAPDILLVQEYTLRWHREIGDELRTRFVYVVDRSDNGLRGLAIFSTFPIEAHSDIGSDTPGMGRPQLRAEIDLGTRRLAVINAHPVTPMSIGKNTIQRRQLNALVRAMRDEELPMIVAGDFNLTETSPSYDSLLDAGVHAGWDDVGSGRGATWHFRHEPDWLPGLRLDHVFASHDITIDRMRLGSASLSDHRATITDVTITRDLG